MEVTCDPDKSSFHGAIEWVQEQMGGDNWNSEYRQPVSLPLSESCSALTQTVPIGSLPQVLINSLARHSGPSQCGFTKLS